MMAILSANFKVELWLGRCTIRSSDKELRGKLWAPFSRL